MNSKLATVVFIFAFIVVGMVGFFRRERTSERVEHAQMRTVSRPNILPAVVSPLPSPLAPTPIPVASPIPPAPSAESHSETAWPLVATRIEKDERGRASAVHFIDGPPAGSTFSLRDQARVIERARDILASTSEVLKLKPGMPLEFPRASMTDTTANVSFAQSIDGIPLVGGGDVSVVMGSHGEADAVYSNYRPELKIDNRFDRIPADGGKHVLYQVSHEGVTHARHAIETRSDGFQVIRDAETGAILLRRDKKIQ